MRSLNCELFYYYVIYVLFIYIKGTRACYFYNYNTFTILNKRISEKTENLFCVNDMNSNEWEYFPDLLYFGVSVYVCCSLDIEMTTVLINFC